MTPDVNDFSIIIDRINAVLHFGKKGCKIEVTFIDKAGIVIEQALVPVGKQGYCFIKGSAQDFLYLVINALHVQSASSGSPTEAVSRFFDMYVWEATVSIRIKNDGTA